MPDVMTPVQELSAAASWLGMQHADLGAGLKSAEDGLKLWRYWEAQGGDVPLLCEPVNDWRNNILVRHVRAALGYNPWSRAAATEG